MATARTFHFRLNSTHTDPNNAVATLHVEQYVNDVWQPFELNEYMPGFQIFAYSCFICQHTYLRMNATEQEMNLAFISGTFTLTTSQDWEVLSVDAEFDAYLSAGEATPKQVNDLIDRMKGCPIARNLAHNVVKHTRLSMHGLSKEDAPCSGSERSLPFYTPKTLTNSTLLSLNSSIL